MSLHQLPNTEVGPKTALAKAAEVVKDKSVVFIVVINGDDLHVLTSSFKTSELCWAAKTLDGHATLAAVSEGLLLQET